MLFRIPERNFPCIRSFIFCGAELVYRHHHNNRHDYRDEYASGKSIAHEPFPRLVAGNARLKMQKAAGVRFAGLVRVTLRRLIAGRENHSMVMRCCWRLAVWYNAGEVSTAGDRSRAPVRRTVPQPLARGRFTS